MQLVALGHALDGLDLARPRASGASTRQEQTSRPLTMTLQAPQSPEPQPSLLPVSPRLSRRTSSRVWLASHRNSVGAPLMVVLTWILAMFSNVLLNRAH